MPTTHDLKIWTEPFESLQSGDKKFEWRKDDRDFEVGDTLHLREWIMEGHFYSGRSLSKEVTYIARGPNYGIPEGFCIMSLKD